MYLHHRQEMKKLLCVRPLKTAAIQKFYDDDPEGRPNFVTLYLQLCMIENSPVRAFCLAGKLGQISMGRWTFRLTGIVCRKFCFPPRSVIALRLIWLWCVMYATRGTGPNVSETTNSHQCYIHILTSFSDHLSDYEKMHTVFLSNNCGKHTEKCWH